MIYAGFRKRTAALLIDICLLLGVFQVTLTVLMVVTLTLLEATELEGRLADATMTMMSRPYLLPLTSVIVIWLYYACSEASSRQATAGKTLMNIQVGRLDGSRLGFGQATVRHFSKYLSALPLLAGFIMAAFTRRKQALHDRIARCVVIKQQDAKSPRETS